MTNGAWFGQGKSTVTIRKADITDDSYQPYIADTISDIALPTLSAQLGTNSITFGTTVQPTKTELNGMITTI